MARGEKIRKADFSHQEFCKIIGTNEKNVLLWLNRLFEMYGIDEAYKLKLKKKQEKGDDYLWPAEWAGLASVILGTISQHPLFAKTADRQSVQERITAEQIVSYYKVLLEKVEGNLLPHLKEQVVLLDSYLATRKMVDKVPVLISKIEDVISALIYVGNEQPGELADYIQRQLDSWLYHLYRHHYYRVLAEQAAKASCKTQLDEAYNLASDEANQNFIKSFEVQEPKPSIPSLDVQMVQLWKEMIDSTSYLNPPGEDGCDVWQEALEIGGVAGLCAEDQEAARMLYGNMFETELDYDAKVLHQAIEDYEERQKRPRTVEELIAKGVEEVKGLTEGEIQQRRAIAAKEQLNREEAELKELIRHSIKRVREIRQAKKREDIGCPFHEEEMQKKYLDFCKMLRKERHKYEKASQLFVGQIILPFLKRVKTDPES